MRSQPKDFEIKTDTFSQCTNKKSEEDFKT